jgi:hypothetical protein
MRLNFNNGAMPGMASRTATRMDRSQENKGTRGGGWFSLFFWPAFRRIFLLDNKLEFGNRQPAPQESPAAAGAKKADDCVIASAVPQIVIDTQVQHWMRRTLESNIDLVDALKRLRNAYMLLQAGKPVKNVDAILAEVEAALKAVEESSM